MTNEEKTRLCDSISENIKDYFDDMPITVVINKDILNGMTKAFEIHEIDIKPNNADGKYSCNCGKELYEGQHFCDNCGQLIGW